MSYFNLYANDYPDKDMLMLLDMYTTYLKDAPNMNDDNMNKLIAAWERDIDDGEDDGIGSAFTLELARQKGKMDVVETKESLKMSNMEEAALRDYLVCTRRAPRRVEFVLCVYGK